MSAWPPGVAEFKAYFVRDFVYGSTPDTVEDSDITQALNLAGMVFNPLLWSTDANRGVAYMYVAAHFLALNIQGAGGLSATATGKGINNAGGGTIESKSVGGVSVSYALPDLVRQSPILSQFMRTGFGQIYLQLITPYLVGNVMLVSGNDEMLSAFPSSALVGYGGSAISPLKITTLELPAGVNAVAYSQTLGAEGGVSPIVFTVTDGALPTGLTLSTAGVISGTPSAAGSYYFTITATDNRGATATQNYLVTIS